jgi:hypothetical protein
VEITSDAFPRRDGSRNGQRGLIAGFGPGVSADFSLGIFL